MSQAETITQSILPSQKLELTRINSLAKYSDYSLEQRLELMAKFYGARSATIERKVHRKDEFFAGNNRKKGTTTLYVKLDSDHYPFSIVLADVPTKESKKKSVQFHATDWWVEYSNPDFIKALKRISNSCLKKMEKLDNKRSARWNMKQYRVLYFDLQRNNLIIEVDSKIRVMRLWFSQIYQGKLLDEIILRSQDKNDFENFPEKAEQRDDFYLFGNDSYYVDSWCQDFDKFYDDYDQKKLREKLNF